MEFERVPFNKLVGIEADADSGGVRLVCSAEHQNHLGTAHAGIVLAVAEAAAGRFLIEKLPEWQDIAIAVLRSASVKYRRPARETLRGIGEASSDASAAFVRRLEKRGRAEIEVGVSVCVEEEVFFKGTFYWFVSVGA